MPESLKHKTIKGLFWSSVERFSVQGVSFLVMLVVARILSPADYGLVGMLTIFTAVAQCLDSKSIHNGMKVMISGFGVGLSWGGTILNF